MVETLVLAAFSFFNSLRVISYLPQILRIARDTGGAVAVSFLTWSMWLCANGSTAAYAAVIIGDRALFLVSAVNTTCCFVVLCQTAYKRRRWRAERDARSSWQPLELAAAPGAATRCRTQPCASPPPG